MPSSFPALVLPLLALVLVAPLAAASPATPASVEGSRPNIVFLLVDDLGWGDLGCYGNETSRTPNIDRLAGEGVRFEQMLVASPICTPSRTAMLTGRHPMRAGMDSSRPNFRVLNSAAHPGGLPRSEVTVAEALRDQAGYSTALVGKWHLGVNRHTSTDGAHLPMHHGFDTFYGLPVTNVQTCGGRRVFAQDSVLAFYAARTGGVWLGALVAVAALYVFSLAGARATLALAVAVLAVAAAGLYYTAAWTLLSPSNCLLYRGAEVIEQPLRLPGLTQRITAEAVQFIEREAANGTRPFFLFLPYVKVHTALFTAPENAGRSGHGDFVDNVEELDQSVGQVAAALERLGLDERTLVVLASDNGPFRERGHEAGSAGPWRGSKGQNWEGGIRVPAFVRWRGTVPPRVTAQMVSAMDLYPTMLRLAGARPPDDGRPVDGVDLTGLLLGGGDAREELLHFCGQEPGAARWRRYKIHWLLPRPEAGTGDEFACEECCPRGVICFCGSVRADPPLLFDLEADPGERSPLPLADHPEAVAAFDRMRREHEASELLPYGGRGAENQLARFVRPWLLPCCNPPACRCCLECSPEEAREHRAKWEY